jgi:hypothetical protein
MIFVLWEKSLSCHSNKWGRFHSWKSIFHPFTATLRNVWKVFLKPKSSLSKIRVCGCELRGVYEPHHKQIFGFGFLFSHFKHCNKKTHKRGVKELKGHMTQKMVYKLPATNLVTLQYCHSTTRIVASFNVLQGVPHPIPSQCVLHGCGITCLTTTNPDFKKQMTIHIQVHTKEWGANHTSQF